MKSQLPNEKKERMKNEEYEVKKGRMNESDIAKRVASLLKVTSRQLVYNFGRK